jgi:hypothetical protein
MSLRHLFVLGAVLAMSACFTPQRKSPVSSSSSADDPFLDRSDPSGDRALVWPHPADSSTREFPDEKPLVSFSCQTQVTGKRPNGTLSVTFRATTPSNVSFELKFQALQPECAYEGSIQLRKGRLNDGFLGKTYVYRCRRSPHSVFAVSCGPYLGSDLNVIVRGNGWGRTVNFRLPWTFQQGIPAESTCRLPFVIYGENSKPKYIDNNQLSFDRSACQVVAKESVVP